MKLKTRLLARVGLGVFFAMVPMVLNADESAVIRLERGVLLMQDESKLEEAIQEFEIVLQSEEEFKKLASEARYRMAECLLKLGKKDEAKKQLKSLRDAYPSKNRWVVKSEDLMSSGPDFAPVAWDNGELAIYDVKLPSGSVLGVFCSAVCVSENEGEKTWTAYFTRGVGGISQSRVEFDRENLKPISAHSYFEGVGEFRGTFEDDGSWEVTDVASGTELHSGKAKPGVSLFDNDQSVQLMRLLPNEIGDEASLPLVVLMGGSELELKMEVVAHEKVVTDFGEFDCAHYKSNIGQEFWVQRDGRRHLVKMKLPGANLELRQVISHWSGEESLLLESKKGHGKLTAPAKTFSLPVVDNKIVYRSRLTDGELRFQVGLVELQPSQNFLAEVRGENKETVALLFKNMNSEEVQVTVEEEKWLEWSREDGKKAAIGTCRIVQGDVASERIQLCSHGEKETLILTFDGCVGFCKTAQPLVKAMFESWEE